MAKRLIVLLLLFSGTAMATAQEEERIISPSSSAIELRKEARADAGTPETPSAGVVLAYLVLLGAGAAFIWTRQRKGGLAKGLLGNKQGIEVCGSRMLGNRQHLIVVEVEGQRMLLGVGPGFISHLSNLPSKGAEASEQDGTATDAVVDLPPVQNADFPFPFSAIIRRVEGKGRKPGSDPSL